MVLGLGSSIGVYRGVCGSIGFCALVLKECIGGLCRFYGALSRVVEGRDIIVSLTFLGIPFALGLVFVGAHWGLAL